MEWHDGHPWSSILKRENQWRWLSFIFLLPHFQTHPCQVVSILPGCEEVGQPVQTVNHLKRYWVQLIPVSVAFRIPSSTFRNKKNRGKSLYPSNPRGEKMGNTISLKAIEVFARRPAGGWSPVGWLRLVATRCLRETWELHLQTVGMGTESWNMAVFHEQR